MIKKLMTLFFGAALIVLPAAAAHAGNYWNPTKTGCVNPEFDAVGCDVANIFVNSVLSQIVAYEAMNDGDLEGYSDFTKYTSGWIFNPNIQVGGQSFPTATGPQLPAAGPWTGYSSLGPPYAGGAHCVSSAGAALGCQPMEFFTTSNTNGQLVNDPCFSYAADDHHKDYGCHFPYKSVFTPQRDGGIYRWRIVLQKKPASDIDITINDCVLTQTLNCNDGIFTNSSETGFYNLSYYLVFLQSALPTITAYAVPGPYASMGFAAPMLLYTRTQPQTSANLSPIQSLPFVSKAFFDESLVIAMPMTGGSSCGNFAQGYTLTGGDMIDISIGIPETINPNEYYFGQDNVLLKYIGMAGTGVYGAKDCDDLWMH